MIEKYYVYECRRKTFVLQHHAAVVMVTISFTFYVSFVSEINTAVKFLCEFFCNNYKY